MTKRRLNEAQMKMKNTLHLHTNHKKQSEKEREKNRSWPSVNEINARGVGEHQLILQYYM